MGFSGRAVRLAAVVAAVPTAAMAVAACPGSSSQEKACSGASALSYFGDYQGFDGTTLAAKTLTLTFDDGPGSQTLAVSAYLKSKGIRAVFFVNGHCFGAGVGSYPQCQQSAAAVPADFFPQILADGHLVQNHTQTHDDLTSTGLFPLNAAGNAAIVKELSDTDVVVSPYVAYGRFLFRPPFGAYNKHDYDVLQASAMSKYVGPVKWDVGGAMTGPKAGSDNAALHYAADWDCWQNLDGFGVKTSLGCATRYMQEIAAVGRGIVLMHDADYGSVANHNLTSGKGNSLDMLKLLIDGDAGLGVTGLIAQGYKFVRLDEVPAIAAVLPPIPDAGPDAAADTGATDSATDGASEGAADGASPPPSSGDEAGIPSGPPPDMRGAPVDPCAPAPVPTP